MENYTEKTDEALVELSHGGDTLADETLYERYKNIVRGKTRPYYLIGADRDDLLQEGMIGLYKAVRDYVPGSASFRTFAEMCVHRQIITAIKTATRQKHIPLNSYVSLYKSGAEPDRPMLDFLQLESEDPAESFLGKERWADMERMLDELLSPMEREALRLYLDNRPYTEIAARLGCSAKSVDNALQRSRKKLEKNIGRLGED